MLEINERILIEVLKTFNLKKKKVRKKRRVTRFYSIAFRENCT